MQALTEIQQVIYMKEFLFKFRAEPDWVHIVHTRPNLIFESQSSSALPRFESNRRLLTSSGFQPASSLLPRAKPNAQRTPAGKRPTARMSLPAASPAPQAKRARQPDGSNRPGRCYSRSDVAVGVCGHNPCIYGHDCATCGADHPAAECLRRGTWNTANARVRSGRPASL